MIVNVLRVLRLINFGPKCNKNPNSSTVKSHVQGPKI